MALASPGRSRTRAAPGLLAALVIMSPTHARPERAEDEPTRPWQSVLGNSWQLSSPNAEDPSLTDAAEGTRGACGTGMVHVRGAMKEGGAASIEALQDSTCTEWISRTFPERCARFDADRWRTLAGALATRPIDVCIDRFEYPDRRRAYPVIAITFDEAAAACSQESKRLCSEDEWTFACEGDEARPYPYGYERDAAACVIDHPARAFHAERLVPRASPRAAAELDRLWQGEASGSHPACRSASGVYDLTGNVDEWTRSSRGGRPSILKGGYWGPVRTRCRPATRAHGPEFFFYQQGFRCCADAPRGAARTLPGG